MLKDEYTNEYSSPQPGEGQWRDHPTTASTVVPGLLGLLLGSEGQEVSDDTSKPQPAAPSVPARVPCWSSEEDASVSLCHSTATTHPSFPFHVLEVRLDSRRAAEPSLPGGPHLHLPLLRWGNDKALCHHGGTSEWED